MVATIAKNTANKTDISVEQQVRNEFEGQVFFGDLDNDTQELRIKEEVEKRNKGINDSSDVSKDMAIKQRIEDNIDAYEQLKITGTQQDRQKFKSDFIKDIIDR